MKKLIILFCLVVSLAGGVFAVDCDGLNLLMHFDEDSSTVQDFSGNGNDGTVTGAIWNSTGKFNGAFEFDGAGDYIITANTSFILSVNDVHSVFAWVNPTRHGGNRMIWNYGEVYDSLYASALGLLNNGSLVWSINGVLQWVILLIVDLLFQ